MKDALQRLFPWSRPAATVPSMDGALRPNRALEEAHLLAQVEAPDNLVRQDGALLFTSGKRIYLIEDPRDGVIEPEEIMAFDHPISALAAAPDGSLAVGLGAGGVTLVGGAHDGREIAQLGGLPLLCPVALCFSDSGTLFVCQGSDLHPPDAWQRDLMERRAGGSVWRVDLASGKATCLGRNLAYPAGILPCDGGRDVVVSEAWRHRLLRLAAEGAPAASVLLDDLPGYPGRLSAAADGGAWMAVFAPRSQLVEFVLRETTYRRWMLREIDPLYWIAPTLRAGRSFKEPMQGGAVKTLGIFKPWAPTRSYGLAVRLDPDFTPTGSLHSRADGRRHGVTSCVEVQGELLVACRGDDALLVVEAGVGGMPA